MRNFETLTTSERYMNPLTRQLSGCELQIKHMRAHLKHRMNNIKEEDLLAQRHQQNVLDTCYHPLFAIPKEEAGVVPPPTHTSSKTDSDEESRCCCTRRVELHNK